jgi:hypothetical protein
MPYLKEDRRLALEQGKVDIKDLAAGDLNYLLTATVLGWLQGKPKNYESLNAAVGALVSCKDEFVRRVVAPYETIKAHENGDMYAEFFGQTRIAVPEQPKIIV